MSSNPFGKLKIQFDQEDNTTPVVQVQKEEFVKIKTKSKYVKPEDKQKNWEAKQATHDNDEGNNNFFKIQRFY